jgi:hypothetical protein
LYTADVGGTPILTAPVLATSLLSTVLVAMTGQTALMNQNAYLVGGTPGVGGRDTYCRLWEGGGSDILSRLYYGDGALWFTMNAHWVDAPTNKWVEDHSTTHAMAVGLFLDGSDVKFGIFRKNYANFSTGWTAWDSSIDWGAVNIMSADMHAYPELTGDIEDQCHFAIGHEKAGTEIVHGIDAVTWHGKFASTPGHVTITAGAEASWTVAGGALVQVMGTTTLGTTVFGYSDGDAFSGLAYYRGTVTAIDD